MIETESYLEETLDRPLYLYRGEDVSETLFQPIGPSGEPIDPSGWDIKLQLYRSRDQGEPSLEKTLSGGGLTVDGDFNIILNATIPEIEALEQWQYELAVRIDDGVDRPWYVTGESFVKDSPTI